MESRYNIYIFSAIATGNNALALKQCHIVAIVVACAQLCINVYQIFTADKNKENPLL